MTSPSTVLARVVVDELARNGMTDACLAPGSRSAPLALALADDARIRLHVRIDERSASFLAVGLAKATRRPVAVVCTSGTATANLHPAVLEADAAGVPLLLLTADRPPELRGAGANQTVDQIKLYGAAVRWFCEVGVAEDAHDANAYWRSTACRAWAEAAGALGAAPGPVHCNLALREPLVSVAGEALPSGRPGQRPWTATGPGSRRPVPDDVDDLRRRIEATPRGLLVAGDVDLAGSDAVLELAAAAGWPLLAEPQSGLRRGPNAMASYDLLLRDDGFAARHRPELVVRIGRAALSKALPARLEGVEQVVVTPSGGWLDPARSAARILTADPALLAAEVLDGFRGSALPQWLASWRAADERVRAAVDAVLDASDEPSEPRTARDLGAAVPPGGLLVVASSMPVRDLDAHLAPREGLRVLANRGASGIDGFVSTAVGAAAGHAGATFALAGDLSLLHDANGLLAADPPDVVLVVLNNDGGGIFSFLPQASVPSGFELVFGTPHGADIAALACAYGAGHVRLDRACDLAEVVATAATAGGVRIVEVRTDREANRALHQRLADAAAAALSGGPTGSAGA